LILSYHGIQEEILDQKSPGPPGWGLMQRASYSLITKKQKMLKNQTRVLFLREQMTALLTRFRHLRVKKEIPGCRIKIVCL
jgi:hypothetical protein